ncbi:divalent-cation tolerance protein CutA [uncultured Reyranella sp.]|uniref:divalent-cation tolerance protein CutA n=1 Tax=uncultured Reyranella sp. TaxID=735512 RepID=UPI0025D1CFCA|nr:divalent-cation tolerance protein CutA [uncultured Reyranella sp.]
MTAIAVVTTVASRKEARSLARAIVEAKLAACAQISRIESIYSWKGALETGKEYRILFKTLDEHYSAVERAILDLHPYEVPAIHAFPMMHVAPAYAAWIEESVAA